MENEIKYTQCSASKILALLPSSVVRMRLGRGVGGAGGIPPCHLNAGGGLLAAAAGRCTRCPPPPPPGAPLPGFLERARRPPRGAGALGRTGRGPAARGLRCGQFTSPRAPHGGAPGTTQGPGGRDGAAGAGRGGKIDSPGCGLELRADAEPPPPDGRTGLLPAQLSRGREFLRRKASRGLLRTQGARPRRPGESRRRAWGSWGRASSCRERAGA